MTAAELVVLFALWALLLWCLRPLQRALTRAVERMQLRSKHGKVIEAKFRSLTPPGKDDGEGPSNRGA